MIIAVPVTGNQPSGPGEAEEIVVFDAENGTEIERYANPALTATSARGIAMLRSVMDRKVDALVVSGIGEHAMNYAKGRLSILSGAGLSLEEVLKQASENSLKEMTEATHMGHHHHH